VQVPETSEWREELRRQSARAIAITCVGICILTLVYFDPREHLGLQLLAGIMTALMIVVARSKRVHSTLSGAASTAAVLVGGGVTIYQLGWMPGPILFLTAAVFMAGALQSRWMILATVAACMGILLGVGYGMASGHVAIPPGNPAMGDFSLWVRVTLFGAVLWAALGFTTSHTLAVVERSLLRERIAATELAEERQFRLEIEESRDAAQAAFVEAQRKQAIAALASGLAHDLNNALMVILSWADMLREGGSDPELVRDANEAISTAAEQASSLARQLLSLGREGASSPSVVDLAALLELDVASLRKLMPRNIEVCFEPRPVAPVLAEEIQLHQVILNLAINARDAMPDGGTLRVSLSDDGQWVAFTIEDSGTGMDAETRAKLFEPFFTTKPGVGTGLGLASTKLIVEQLGGQIEVGTQLGRGTRFTIRLPGHPELAESALTVDAGAA
jgi:signal transduction histidine kinase